MQKRKEIFWEFISILNENGLLRDLVIIGSWAEYIYSLTILPAYQEEFVTGDVDILIPNINRPPDNKGLPETLIESGYLMAHDPLTNATKFYKQGELEVEFLTTVKGSGKELYYMVRSLGIMALGIRNLDLLSQYRIPLYVNNYLVNVPCPQIYILHKLLINRERGEKKEKDLLAIRNILFFLQRDPVQILEMQRIYNQLTTKQIKIIDEICESEKILLF